MRISSAQGSKTNIKGSLDRNNYFCIRVQGTSMRPFLQDEDMITVKYIDLSEIAPGDIIVYQNIFQERIIHRVLRKNIKNGKIVFLAKGDAQAGPGYYICGEQILGKAIFRERRENKLEIRNGPMNLRRIFHNKLSILETFIYSIRREIRYWVRHRILGGVLRRIQGSRLYAYFIRRIIQMDKITYRIATVSDTASVARFYSYYCWPTKLKILNESFEKFFKNFRDTRYFLLAQIKDKIIGSIIIRPSLSEGGESSERWIYDLFLNWFYRSLGVEKQLIKLAVEKAKKDGGKIVRILVPKRNVFLLELLRRLYGDQEDSQFDKETVIFTRLLN
ncbi:signal peptidase I [Candidatus Omnitrophota bacterium]